MLIDESSEMDTKQKLIQLFRRRIDQLDIKRHRIIKRLGECVINVMYGVKE